MSYTVELRLTMPTLPMGCETVGEQRGSTILMYHAHGYSNFLPLNVPQYHPSIKYLSRYPDTKQGLLAHLNVTYKAQSWHSLE